MSVPGYADVPADLWMGAEWLPAVDGTRIPVWNPATGGQIAEVAAGGVADVHRSIDAAEESAPSWAQASPRERSDVLRRAYEIMTAEVEDIAKVIVLENGKSLSDARAEVSYAAEFFRWFSEECVRLSGQLQRSPSGRHRILTLNQPIGISLLVTPWNFPAAMGTRKIAPAIAAGCTVVVKPSTDTPLTMLVIGDILHRAGLPPGVVNIIVAKSSSEVVSAALEDPRVRKLSFTGSTNVGRALLAKGAENVTSVSMELGGNAPFIVFDSADVPGAVASALVAKMRNGGASCIAANCFYLSSTIVDQFTDLFTEAMERLRFGDGLLEDSDIGSLITEKARQNVVELVERTVAMGAKVRCGGYVPDRTGWFYPPTVLTDVPHDAEIVSHEIFGPVAPMVSFSSEEEVMSWANSGELGLAAYVQTQDLEQALRVSEGLQVGMVGINRGYISDPAAPFGGVKQSGIGREGGDRGIYEFCETKYVAVDW